MILVKAGCSLNQASGFSPFCFVLLGFISSPFAGVMWLTQFSWGPLFTKRQDVLPSDPVKYRSRQIGCCIALKFDNSRGSTAAETPAKFQRQLYIHIWKSGGKTSYCFAGLFHCHQRNYPESKVHGANMGSIWGRRDPGGSHVGPMNFAFFIQV